MKTHIFKKLIFALLVISLAISLLACQKDEDVVSSSSHADDSEPEKSVSVAELESGEDSTADQPESEELVLPTSSLKGLSYLNGFFEGDYYYNQDRFALTPEMFRDNNGYLSFEKLKQREDYRELSWLQNENVNYTSKQGDIVDYGSLPEDAKLYVDIVFRFEFADGKESALPYYERVEKLLEDFGIYALARFSERARMDGTMWCLDSTVDLTTKTVSPSREEYETVYHDKYDFSPQVHYMVYAEKTQLEQLQTYVYDEGVEWMVWVAYPLTDVSVEENMYPDPIKMLYEDRD